MSNFKEDVIDILKYNNDLDNVKFVRIEDERNYHTKESEITPYIGKLIDLETALKLFDYQYNSGFGSQDCNSFTIWTDSKIYVIHEYDGSTSIVWYDRNPIESTK
jgi:hypothetical protein